MYFKLGVANFECLISTECIILNSFNENEVPALGTTAGQFSARRPVFQGLSKFLRSEKLLSSSFQSGARKLSLMTTAVMVTAQLFGKLL